MTEQQTLRLPARFDFSQHKTFTASYENVFTQSQIKELVLDFSGVDYLDSSALGMLVLLQKKAAVSKVKVVLRGARGTAKDILNMANMHKLFVIEG